MREARNIVIIGLINLLSVGASAEDFFSCESARGDTTGGIMDQAIYLAEKILDHVTVERERWSMAVYPAASYSGRSGLSVGVMPMLQFRDARMPKPATLTPSLLISTKKMFEIQCDADVHLRHGIDITAKGEMYRQPDEFYEVGVGGESIAKYNFGRRMLTMEAVKTVGEESAFRIGVNIDADYYKFTSIEVADSMRVAAGRLWGDAGGSYGMGISLGVDTRDDVLSPRKGWYARIWCTGYAKILDSSHKFGIATLDARRYIGIGEKTVVGVQLYASHSWGDVPFVKMPTFGGTRLGRAVGHNLKYIDNDAWLMQCEWRVPLFWRIGATVFGAAGNTSDGIDGVLDDIHIMGGGGLRFAVFAGKGLNVRLDAGVGTHGDHAIYFNIREAF